MRDLSLHELGLSLRGGLHVPAARLRLDDSPAAGLRFVPQWDGRRRSTGRLLCSRTLGLWLHGKQAPLAVPYGKPFQLGKLALELLPTGTSLGSAMVRMQLGGHTVLVARAARLDALPSAEPLAWREADVLVLHADDARERVDTAGLRAFVAEAVALVQAGARVALVLGQATVALDVLLLAGPAVPVRLSPKLERLAQASAATGLELPGRSRRRGPGLLLTTASEPVAAVDHVRTIAPDGQGEGQLAFAREASGGAWLALALASGARQVFVTGAAAPILAERLRTAGVAASPVSETGQLPLV